MPLMSMIGAAVDGVGAAGAGFAGLNDVALAERRGMFPPWFKLRVLGVGFLPQKRILWPTFPHFPHVGGFWHRRCV